MSTEQIETAAEALGPLLSEVVFLGGASIHLWLSDPGAPPARATQDVDVISEVTSRSAYYQLGERLRERGFSEASDSNVICRWRHRDSGLLLDVMPDDEEVLGFSNAWYRHAITTAADRRLRSGTAIRAATPPSIVATKLAAWNGRGEGDILGSLDLHDILVLVNGREELPGEVAADASDLQSYIKPELTTLRQDPYFAYLMESAISPYGPLTTTRIQYLQGQLDAITDQP